MNVSDTICALATPPGVAGLAVIRVSGSESFKIADLFFRGQVSLVDSASHTIHFGWWWDGEDRVDSVTCSVFRAPSSYTAEDVVEVGCHGGHVVVGRIISCITLAGCRHALPGEFTRRAFLNGKLDLTQAEAVADIIHAESSAGASAAARQLAGGFTRRLDELYDRLTHAVGLLELELDFAEEDITFVNRDDLVKLIGDIQAASDKYADLARAAEMLRSGFYCAVAGYPNAGKSSLFNALLRNERAIVSEVPGTTRDYLEEVLYIDGYSVHLYDTAGLRDSADAVEMAGIRMASSLLERSNMILVVNDASLGEHNSAELMQSLQSSYPDRSICLLQNKADLVTGVAKFTGIHVSALTGVGLDAVEMALLSAVKASTAAITDVLVNARQAGLLRSVARAVDQALSALSSGATNELVVVDLRDALALLGEITGRTWHPDILQQVFARFCIGK